MAKIWPKMAKIFPKPQTLSDLAQTWHTGSLGQVQWTIFFVWPKNENGRDIAKNAQKGSILTPN